MVSPAGKRFARGAMRVMPAVTALLILGVVVLRWGRGETTEFSPEALCYRQRDVWYIPLVNVPLFSWVTRTWPHPLRKMWAENGYISGSEAPRAVVGPQRSAALQDDLCGEEREYRHP